MTNYNYEINNEEFRNYIHNLKPYVNISIKLEDESFKNNLYLKKYYSCNLETDVHYVLKTLKKYNNFQKIRISGGGSCKYQKFFNEMLNVEVIKVDELQSLLYGYAIMNEYNTMYHLINKNIKAFTEINYEANNNNDNNNNNNLNTKYLSSENASIFNEYNNVNYLKINSIQNFTFPHLVVNIGSGVSIVKVINENDIERIGGTMCGGGTLIGLSKILLGIDDFNEIIKLAKKGDHKNLDLLVSDIYGKSILSDFNNNKIGLECDVLASSFGKVHHILSKNKEAEIKKEDIAQSLLILICFQIAQLGYLYAKQHDIKDVFYYGNFTQKDSFAIELLDFGTRFWDKNIKAHFNDLDGYLGSIGCLCNKYE